MADFKCKICSSVFMLNGEKVGFCSQCGNFQTVPLISDDRTAEMYLKAHDLRMSGQYEKAMGIYELIASDSSYDPEVYWSLVLCRYGVRFTAGDSGNEIAVAVDKATDRTVFNDSDFKSVLFYADDRQKEIYTALAHKIDEAQRKNMFGSGTAYREEKNVKKASVQQRANTESLPGNADALIKRAFIFLEDRKWFNASSYFDRVLDSDPENAEAYLGKLMSEVKVSKKEDLRNCPAPFDGTDNFSKVMRFADASLCEELKGYNTYIRKRNETARLEKIYSEAQNKFKNAKTAKDFEAAASLFASVAHYKDAKDMKFEASKNAEMAEKAVIYDKACILMKRKNEKNYRLAAEEFAKAEGYKDSAEKIQECNEFLELVKARKESKEAAYDITFLKMKKVFAVLSVVSVALSLFVMLIFSVIIPGVKYIGAEKVFNEKSMGAALDSLDSLGNFLDAEEKIDELLKKYTVDEDKNAFVLEDGTVFIKDRQSSKKYESSSWTDIVKVAANDECVAGVTADGKVLVSKIAKDTSGAFDTSSWRNIVDVSMNSYYLVAVDSRGECFADTVSVYEWYQDTCNDIERWVNISSVVMGSYSAVVGIHPDGTVSATELSDDEMYDIYEWENVVSVAVGYDHAVGLLADGTVVACGDNEDGQCNVFSWKDVVAVSAYNNFTVALLADGTVKACGDNEYGQCDVQYWENVIAIAAAYTKTYGLCEDGTVLCTDFSYRKADWNSLDLQKSYINENVYNNIVNPEVVPEVLPETEDIITEEETVAEETTMAE